MTYVVINDFTMVIMPLANSYLGEYGDETDDGNTLFEP